MCVWMYVCKVTYIYAHMHMIYVCFCLFLFLPFTCKYVNVFGTIVLNVYIECRLRVFVLFLSRSISIF